MTDPLCIIGSRFIHLIRTDLNMFFIMAKYYSIAHMYQNFFTHSSVDRHLGCFHVLAVVNHASVKLGCVHPFRSCFSLGICPGVGLQHHAAAAAKSLQSCPTLCDPIDGSPQVLPSLGFSRQEHWSELPFPSPMHEGEKRK